MQDESDDFDNFPVTYSIDNQILMHRDAHFGGNFDLMLDYYKKNGKGVNNDFEISRIEDLQKTQMQSGRDLSTFMLSGPEIEKIAASKTAYKTLRDLYSLKKEKNKLPLLIADLILTEDPNASSEIQAVIAEKSAIVPALVDLLRNEDFHDPLFPGYGQAPTLAAKCLGLIGDKRSIISLFEAIGEGDFVNDDIVLDALHAVGDPAKAFLLKVLHAQPLNHDNEQAAIALVNFKDDPEVSATCLKMLQEIDLKKHESLATYLVLASEGLSNPSQQQQLLQLASLPTTPKSLRQDINAIAKNWKSPNTK